MAVAVWCGQAGASELALKLAPAEATRMGARDAELVQLFIDETVARLPPVLRRSLPMTVAVRFPSLNPNQTRAIPPVCAGSNTEVQSSLVSSQKRGEVKLPRLFSPGYEVRIDELLLAPIIERMAGGVENTPSFPCHHHTLFETAQATLVHEIAHIYDHENIRPESELQLYRECRLDQERSRQPECATWQEYVRTISSTARFQSLTFWKTGWYGQPVEKNLKTESAPDGYAWTDPEETFAVEFEYFVLDAEYGCRRPSLQAYFQQHFGGFDPYPQRTCRRADTLQTISASSTGNVLLNSATLDPSRIYQIHYLHAGKGKALMSRWGHAMFRVVLCAPDRKEIGPTCLQDRSYHFVMGFAADIDEPWINSWKGLFGGYPSRISIMPYLDTVYHYTRDEFREVESLPLKLSREELSAVAQQLLESYWAYQGAYAFFTNNCAQEALELLQRAVDRSSVNKIGIMSPIGLRKALINADLVDVSSVQRIPSDLDRARRRFEIVRPYLAVKLSKKPVSVETFIRSSTADDRLEIAKRIVTAPADQIQENATGKKFTHLAALFFIEDQFIAQRILRKINQVSEELIWNYFEYLRNEAVKQNFDGVQSLLNHDKNLFLSAEFGTRNSGGGYGIPLISSVLEQEPGDSTETTQKVLNQHSELIDAMKKTTQPLTDEFKKIQRNRSYLLHQLALLKLS